MTRFSNSPRRLTSSRAARLSRSSFCFLFLLLPLALLFVNILFRRSLVDPSIPEKSLGTDVSMDFAMKTWYTSKATRDKWRRQVGSNAQQKLTQEIPNLNRVEIDNTISDGCAISNNTLKLVGFNAERGTHWDKFARLIDKEHPHADIIILNEMDIGMARSGNMHTTRRLALTMKMNYIFGLEFIELTRGTKEEQEATKGKRNALGLYGNAILTKCRIGNDVLVVRDPLSSDYFSNVPTAVNADGHEIRLGGRMGMFARVHHQDQHFVVGSVHKLAESEVNQAAVKEYLNQTATNDSLGVVVQGDFQRTVCQWAGLQNADNTEHYTWPASCKPKVKLGTHRGDNICTNMHVVGEDQVLAPCFQAEGGAIVTLSDHALVSAVLETKHPVHDKYIQNDLKETKLAPTELTADSILFGAGTYNLDNPDKINWSQYGQDRFIDDYFKQKKGGTFLEVGGYDGELYSNTLFLERSRGWSGVLIEANPFTFEMMKSRDRKCWMVHACVSNTVPEMSFFIAGGLTSASELMSDAMKDRINYDMKIYKDGKTWAGAGKSRTVKCFSLEDLLANTVQTTHIDYFSLDVEGAEMHLLQSFDFNKLTIDVFTIEMQENADEIRNFMKEHGYKEVKKNLGVDSVFVRNGFSP